MFKLFRALIALERYAGLTGMRVEKQPTVTIEF